MLNNRTVLYKGSSAYGAYEIVDEIYNDRPARVLYGDGYTPQSGTALDEEPELLFSYNQRFLEITMSHQPQNLLVIGGGGFMLPTAAYHRFPGIHIDVVEIDELLVELAKEYFDLPTSDRLAVQIGDGAAFVAATNKQYDMIILDAFSGNTIPEHLISSEGVKNYQQHLTQEGVIAVNFISEYAPGAPSLANQLLKTFGEVFQNVSMYQADLDYPEADNQNFILVAGNKAHSFDYLQSTEVV